MANLNKVMLIGNVTRDPEVKYTPKGSAVTDLGIAVNRVYTPEGGEKREETTFVDITLWGRQAEIAGEYCKKGRSIYIEGRLQLDTWEDKTSVDLTPQCLVWKKNIMSALSAANPQVMEGLEPKPTERSHLILRQKKTTFRFKGDHSPLRFFYSRPNLMT